MKTTLITLLALATMAQAGSTIITLGESNGDHSFVTDAYVLNNTGATTYNLSDGSTLVMTPSTSKFWGTSNSGDGTITGTWTNEAALIEVNTAVSAAFTSADFSAGNNLCFTATGNSGSTSTATLTLNPNLVINEASSITMYVSATAKGGNLGDFSVSGLTNTTMSYATNGGDGFAETPTFSSGAGAITIIKITGNISTEPIVLSSTSGKNGWQSISYKVTPEPATATLSLLALAGLAARRKRQ